jgi:hypothetical protein
MNQPAMPCHASPSPKSQVTRYRTRLLQLEPVYIEAGWRETELAGKNFDFFRSFDSPKAKMQRMDG